MLDRQNIFLALISLLLGAALGIGSMALTNRARPAPIIINTPRPTLTPAPTATLLPTATPGPLTVHVNGAVATPGVYQLPAGSIVQTAIDAAGGFLAGANASIINLAQPLMDGTQVYVPTMIERPVTPAAVLLPPEIAGNNETEKSFAVESGELININQASAAELEALPGVGPSTAASIVRFRDEQGPFSAIEGLLDVSGIGPAKFAQMRDYITVDP